MLGYLDPFLAQNPDTAMDPRSFQATPHEGDKTGYPRTAPLMLDQEVAIDVAARIELGSRAESYIEFERGLRAES